MNEWNAHGGGGGASFLKKMCLYAKTRVILTVCLFVIFSV